MITIIQLTRDEAAFIRKMRPGVHVSRPTPTKKYFMEEERDAMRLLRDYRNGKYGFGRKQ